MSRVPLSVVGSGPWLATVSPASPPALGMLRIIAERAIIADFKAFSLPGVCRLRMENTLYSETDSNVPVLDANEVYSMVVRDQCSPG